MSARINNDLWHLLLCHTISATGFRAISMVRACGCKIKVMGSIPHFNKTYFLCKRCFEIQCCSSVAAILNMGNEYLPASVV